MGNEEVSPAELIANDKNWRTHPASQRSALAASIEEIGFIRSVTVNRRNNRIIDGHLRVKYALETGQEKIPVEWVDLTEDEEARALALIDPLAAMAEADKVALDGLLRKVTVSAPDLQAMLAKMADQAGLYKHKAGEPEADGGPEEGAAAGESEEESEGDDEGEQENETPGVIQYSIIFDNQDQLDRWYRFLKKLREAHSDMTIGGRIDAFLAEHEKE